MAMAADEASSSGRTQVIPVLGSRPQLLGVPLSPLTADPSPFCCAVQSPRGRLDICCCSSHGAAQSTCSSSSSSAAEGSGCAMLCSDFGDILLSASLRPSSPPDLGTSTNMSHRLSS